MSELIDVINQIVQQNVKGSAPADMMTGSVLSVSPLSVQTEMSTQPIPEAALIVTETVKRKETAVQGGAGGTVVINEGLQAGDKVLMLRVSKGQRYIILSKL